jgi:hypothetical protein
LYANLVGNVEPVVTGVCGRIAGAPAGNGVGTYLPGTAAPAIGPTPDPIYRGNAF